MGVTADSTITPTVICHPVPEVSPTDLLENKRNSFSRCNGNSSMIIIIGASRSEPTKARKRLFVRAGRLTIIKVK